MEIRSKRRLASEINVVPYIDVMLVLLIIFMVTAPLMTSGVDVELPETSNTESSAQTNEEPVVLTVDRNGLMYLDVGAKHAPLSPLGDAASRQGRAFRSSAQGNGFTETGRCQQSLVCQHAARNKKTLSPEPRLAAGISLSAYGAWRSYSHRPFAGASARFATAATGWKEEN